MSEPLASRLDALEARLAAIEALLNSFDPDDEALAGVEPPPVDLGPVRIAGIAKLTVKGEDGDA